MNALGPEAGGTILEARVRLGMLVGELCEEIKGKGSHFDLPAKMVVQS